MWLTGAQIQEDVKDHLGKYTTLWARNPITRPEGILVAAGRLCGWKISGRDDQADLMFDGFTITLSKHWETYELRSPDVEHGGGEPQ